MVDTTRNIKLRKEKTSLTLFRYADRFVTYPAGAVIFQRGDPGDCMYIVKSGAVNLFVGALCVERVQPGEVFGEMALLDEPRRSARAVATEPCQLVPLTQAHFDRLVSQGPFFAKEVLRILSRRIRRTNAKMLLLQRAALPPSGRTGRRPD